MPKKKRRRYAVTRPRAGPNRRTAESRHTTVEAVEAFRSLRSDGPPPGDPSGPAHLRKAFENPGTPARDPYAVPPAGLQNLPTG